jgi:hypothetical protein
MPNGKPKRGDSISVEEEFPSLNRCYASFLFALGMLDRNAGPVL